jgi:hypothetical protein
MDYALEHWESTTESRVKQDLGIWNHLGVVVNWLLGKLLVACEKHLGNLLGAVENTWGST